MDACIMCGLTVSDDEEREICANGCIGYTNPVFLPHYSHAETDDIFIYPEGAVYFYHHHH